MSLPDQPIGSVEPVFPSDVGGAAAQALSTGRTLSPEEVRALVADVSKMRHELNNHLMAALAEIQLLLMDVDGEELRQSYEIIQESLRAMRTVVARPKPKR